MIKQVCDSFWLDSWWLFSWSRNPWFYVNYMFIILLTKSDLGQQNNFREYFISCNSLPLQRTTSSSQNVNKHWDSTKVLHIKKGSHTCMSLPYACHSQSWECQPQKESSPIVLCSARVNFFPTLVRYIIILSCDFSTFCLKCTSQNAGRAYVTQEFSLISSLEYSHNAK